VGWCHLAYSTERLDFYPNISWKLLQPQHIINNRNDFDRLNRSKVHIYPLATWKNKFADASSLELQVCYLNNSIQRRPTLVLSLLTRIKKDYYNVVSFRTLLSNLVEVDCNGRLCCGNFTINDLAFLKSHTEIYGILLLGGRVIIAKSLNISIESCARADLTLDRTQDQKINRSGCEESGTPLIRFLFQYGMIF